jgi:glucose/mannose transport system substrate-binding protein
MVTLRRADNKTSLPGKRSRRGPKEEAMIKKWHMAAVAAGLAGVAYLTPVNAADDLTAQVVHVWTAAGERKAALVLATAYEKAGGKWVDVAVAGAGGPLRTTINRILAGDPPSAGQFSSSRDYYDMLDKNQLADIDDVAKAQKWADKLPPAVLEAISYKGKVYLAPVNIHTPNWIWYNKAVLAKAGAAEPKKLDDTFFAALDKVKAAGFTAFALAGQPSQERFVFEAFMLSLGGPDHWNKVWKDKDEKSIRSDLQKQIFTNFKRLSGYVDQGYSGRAWNPTINMVIAGQAGFDILGDWAKAEFAAAGQTAEKEFGCVIAGDYAIIHGDMFGFPLQKGATGSTPAQKLLAEVVVRPDVQREFNIFKGATPARTDADTNGFDPCSQKALGAFKAGKVVGNARSFMNPPAVGDYMDLLVEYFDSPSMTADQAVDRFAKIVLNALK